MRKCEYCDDEELCGIKKENIPVCEKHFNDYLNGKRLEINSAILIGLEETNENPTKQTTNQTHLEEPT